MIPTLYKTFQRWSRTGSVYIISDTHFDDKDCKLMGSEWISPEEHIAKIKEKVHKTDTLIHLGDVGDMRYLMELNCYKVLIMGNHDSGANNYLRKEERVALDDFSVTEIEEMLKRREIDDVEYRFHSPFTVGIIYRGLFDEVYTGPLMIAENIILSHEPIPGINWCMNIHGHDHSRGNKGDANHVNLAANVVDFEVFNLGKEIKNGLLGNITTLHRITIDEAARRSAERQND